MTTLVVTNDFPPAVGGIETFAFSLVSRLPASEVVVLTRHEQPDVTCEAPRDSPITSLWRRSSRAA